MKKQNSVALFCAGLLLLLAAGQAGEAPGTSNKTVDMIHPGLASGVLTFARLADLPAGVLLRAGTLEIRASDLDGELAGVPAALQAQLKKNLFFLLENLATKRLLLAAAAQALGQPLKTARTQQDEAKLIQAYFDKMLGNIQVTDAEAKAFFEANQDMFGGVKFEQIKDGLKNYVLQEKQQKAVRDHVRSLGQRMAIEVSAAWTAEQAVLARDNPVDKARASGKPALVDFGSTGCAPCEMMAPILETLKKKYEGKAHVLFVQVQEEQILAARYGIESIPVQIFFDKDGKEVFRHVGFYPQSEIEKKMAEMGVQ